MNKSKFEERISVSFKSETPDILDKIKSSDQFFVPDKVKKYDFSKLFNKRFTYSLASVFVLVLILFSVLSSGSISDPVVASTVTIDINPSIQITLDDEDNVINVTAINNDGDLLIDHDIKYRGLTLDRTIEILISKALELGYIFDETEENIILIDVQSNLSSIKERVENALTQKITYEMNKGFRQVLITKANRDNLTENEATNLQQNATQYKLSLAKLYLINSIIEIDSSYTILSLKDLSVRELYNILYTLVPELEGQPGNSGNSGNN